MKYGKEYEQLLASNPNYQQWSSASIRYKALKKIIASVATELSDVGLDAAVLRELFANSSKERSNGGATGIVPSANSRLHARAEYELAGTPEQPEPRIKLVFASESSASSSEGEVPDAVLLKRLHDNLQIQQTDTESQSQSGGEERFDEIEDSAEADVSASATDADIVLPRSDSKLMLRMYGIGVTPAHLSTPPGSPDTLKARSPNGSPLKTGQPTRKNSVPELMLPKSHTPYSHHMNDADDESEEVCVANSKAHRKHRRPSRTVYIPLKTDTQFFGLLAQAIDSLQKLEIAQKEEFAQRVNDLAARIAKCGSPSKSKRDMYAWREIFSIWIEAQIFESSRERDRGERKIDDATTRLHWFVDEVGRRKLARKFKLAESKIALQQFLDLNEALLDLKKFIEANEQAVRKILKKHDKRTALFAATEFPQLRTTLSRGQDGSNGELGNTNQMTKQSSAPMSTSPSHLLWFGDESLPHVLLSTFTEKLLPIIPQLDDFICLICGDVAYRPIKLDCGHKFCLRCLVKMQKRKQDPCPHCRAPVVLKADRVNLDIALEQFLELYFPKEVRKKAKENSKESTNEMMHGGEEQRCLLM